MTITDTAGRLTAVDIASSRPRPVRDAVVVEVLAEDYADLLRDREWLRALLGRALGAIPSWPCCSDVLEGHCYCPRGMLKHELRVALGGAAGELDPAVEDETHRLRRLAGR